MNNEPSYTYNKQKFVCGLEIISVILKPNDQFFQCAYCVLDSRLLLVLKCGDPSCHWCFYESFRQSPKCNHYQTPVQIEDVMTLTDDRIKRPCFIDRQNVWSNFNSIHKQRMQSRIHVWWDPQLWVYFNANFDLLNARLIAVTSRTCLPMCTSMRLSVRFIDFIAKRAVELTAQMLPIIAVHWCLNAD